MSKFLFDHNLSPKLVLKLKDLFPGSCHVYTIGLDKASDREIWEYANSNGFTIVTKDADFVDLSLLRGYPPQVVWIRRGNCKVSVVESLLRECESELIAFKEAKQGFISLL